MQDIVDEAYSWIGTPFVHQARLKGVGVDCLGFVLGVLRATGHDVEDCRTYTKIEHNQAIVDHFLSQTEAIEEPIPGCIVHYLWWDNRTRHVAIYVGNNRIVHCLEGNGKKRGAVALARTQFNPGCKIIGYAIVKKKEM